MTSWIREAPRAILSQGAPTLWARTLNLFGRVRSLKWTLKLGNIIKTTLLALSVVKIVPMMVCS